LEGVLGFEKRGARLRLDPCIPAAWPGFAIDYRFGTSTYAIDVQNPDGVSRGVAWVTVDGHAAQDGLVNLVDDGLRHTVIVVLGAGERNGLAEDELEDSLGRSEAV